MTQRSVFNEQNVPADAAVKITTRDRSISFKRAGTEMYCSSDLPAPMPSRQQTVHEDHIPVAAEKKPEPRRNARRAGMQPFWEYLWISTLPVPMLSMFRLALKLV